MFIRRIKKKVKGKTYVSVYLAESYRDENGKVRHRHIANLSKMPQELILKLEKILKEQKYLSLPELNLKQGKSFGAIYVIKQVAKRLGITRALGNEEQGKLALFQIAGRIISQGSRHYLAKEWKNVEAVEEIFGLKEFTHNDLYSNLKWLSENQSQIERKIFRYRNKDKSIKQVFLYDITSSYLEGKYNELAAYGYNRDKKKGKKQIVIGLLTDSEGYPVSVEVFRGNTSDSKTVSGQLEKLKKRFGVERVVFVGDKGMLKSVQIDEITSKEYNWYYLTSISKSQIERLIKEGVFQMELFSEDLIEIENSGVRYILRRNPVRAEQVKKNRDARIDNVKDFINQLNKYLTDHKKSKPEVALRKVREKILAYHLKTIINCDLKGRRLVYSIDEEALEKAERLDGCYVLKTNVSKQDMDKETAHARYKDLSQVEWAFRTLKTGLEHVRPIYVRKSSTTRGHVFVAILAYMIVKYIKDATSNLGYSIKHVINLLDRISYLEYDHENEKIRIIPELTDELQKILKELGIKIKVK